jgi:recombination protein RecT
MSEKALQKKAPANLLVCIGSDQWKNEVAKVIPKEVTLEAVLRVARSVASEAKFSACDPRSFLLALLKCSRAGLYPDGREAHLIPFKNEVQAIFDWKGLVALANRAGYLVTAKLVHQNDEFSVEEDDGCGHTKVVHKVDYRNPRGELQAVYSRAIRSDGQVDYEIMTAEEVEQIRQRYSRAKDSTPWTLSWGEMAKKTVIKRHSKRWDMSPEIRQAINADDDSATELGQQPKISAPIFKEKAPVTIHAAEEMPQLEEQNDPLVLVLNLCRKDGVDPDNLLEFLKSIDKAEDDDLDLSSLNRDSLMLIVENWDDWSRRVKESQ